MYIHCHPQTDCFVVSQLFSVDRHAGRFKQGSKPSQLNVRLSILPLSQQMTYISLGVLTHYVLAFACFHFALPDTRVLNSLEELCIMWMAAVNSFTRVLNPLEGSGFSLFVFFVFLFLFFGGDAISERQIKRVVSSDETKSIMIFFAEIMTI